MQLCSVNTTSAGEQCQEQRRKGTGNRQQKDEIDTTKRQWAELYRCIPPGGVEGEWERWWVKPKRSSTSEDSEKLLSSLCALEIGIYTKARHIPHCYYKALYSSAQCSSNTVVKYSAPHTEINHSNFFYTSSSQAMLGLVVRQLLTI